MTKKITASPKSKPRRRKFPNDANILSMVTDAIKSLPKDEINRRKQARLRARLDLVARRLGFLNWGDFGKSFSAKMIELEKSKASEQQVNGAIKFMMLRAMKAIPDGKNKIPDAELQAVTESAPRVRENW